VDAERRRLDADRVSEGGECHGARRQGQGARDGAGAIAETPRLSVLFCFQAVGVQLAKSNGLG
jgi:hypothetical protein